MNKRVVLVDEDDNEVGTEEKLKAHLGGGKLHRAFSIFIFNSRKEMLVQRRHEKKYHSPGMWANACCSHPSPGESLEQAVHKRLKEEMGFDCKLKEVFSFIYRGKVGKGLVEHELDHVFIGEHDGEPKPDPEEISEWKWVGLKELREDVKKHPGKYACWFKIALDRVLSHYAKAG